MNPNPIDSENESDSHSFVVTSSNEVSSSLPVEEAQYNPAIVSVTSDIPSSLVSSNFVAHVLFETCSVSECKLHINDVVNLARKYINTSQLSLRAIIKSLDSSSYTAKYKVGQFNFAWFTFFVESIFPLAHSNGEGKLVL